MGSFHGSDTVSPNEQRHHPLSPALLADQVRLLSPGHPYAFFFETLEESRHYAISLDGVDNAETRTGAFTTLKVPTYAHASSANGSAVLLMMSYRRR